MFVAEGHGDALALCHPVIAATSRVRVGTAIANAALRPPVLAAKTAAQLDQASGGRFLLGLGVANDVMNGRFGLTPFPPLPMVAEYVAVVRAVLAGDPAGFAGKLFRTGMVPLDSPPVRPGLPVYLAALGPRMLELAGRIADGVILNLMSPAQAGRAAALVRAAAVAAGRDAGGRRGRLRGARLPGRRPGRGRGRGARGRAALHPASGGRPPVRRLRRGGASWRRPATVRWPVTGPARRSTCHSRSPTRSSRTVDAAACRLRLAEYRAAGVDLPVVFPMPVAGDWGYERVIAALSAQAVR